MTLERLREILAAIGLSASTRELTEILWLACQLTPEQEVPDGPSPDSHEENQLSECAADQEAADTGAQPGEAPDTRAGQTSQIPAHGLYADAARSGLNLNANPVQVPTAPMLPSTLAIQRALRPLKRKVASDRAYTLDEEATARHIAEQPPFRRHWVPILKPSAERWLNLALVVDTSPSMWIWRPLARELQEALIRLGAFRDLHIWYLREDKVATTPGGPPLNAAALPDPSGRQACLVLSDCSGPHWWNGSAVRALRLWGQSGPTAILQPLTERLWRRTATPPIPGLAQARRAAAPNTELTFSPYDASPGHGMPVPVMEISAAWLADWARLVAGSAGAALPMAAAFLPSKLLARAEPLQREHELPIAERVQRFQATASREAARLAAHVAVSEPTLPVMRLIHRQLVEDPQPGHIAEVLLSGLLRPAGTGLGTYEFIPGARQALLSTLPRSEGWYTVDTLNRISSEIVNRLDQTGDFFRAYLQLPGPGERALVSSRPFALVSPEAVLYLRQDIPAPRSPSTQPGIPAIDHSGDPVIPEIGLAGQSDMLAERGGSGDVPVGTISAQGGSARPGTDPKILCVHGMGQQHNAPSALREQWSMALRDGLRGSTHDGFENAPEQLLDENIQMVFYGDLFRRSGDNLTDPGERKADPLSAISKLEEEILEHEGRIAAGISSQAGQAEVKPRRDAKGGGIESAISALKKLPSFRELTSIAIVSFFRDLSEYLKNPVLRAAVQQRFSDGIDERTRVIVAHSLGTIVAYEALCAHPEWPVRTLITLGSPLGIPSVFNRLNPAPRPETGDLQPLGHWPGGIDTWINIVDDKDPIAAVNDLGRLFGPRVVSLKANNGAQAHAALRYLRARETGTAILSGLSQRPAAREISVEPPKAVAADRDPASARRYLLTGVVSRYQHEPTWNREELADDLQRMVNLFTGELGYQHVPAMGLDPSQRQIQDALRDFSTDPGRQPDDYVVVYLAGHGEILPVGESGAEHVLLPADASPRDLRRRAVRSTDLAEWILAGTVVRRLLLIVDACLSGQGGLDFAHNVMVHMGKPARLMDAAGSGVVVVTATQPQQQAIAGAFTSAFTRAVRSQATAGHAPGALDIGAIMSVLNADPKLPRSQQSQWSLVAGGGKIPDFLLNPRYDAALIDLDLKEQDRRWQARRALEHRRAEEMRGQFVPRAAGFTGRHRALIDITRWLHSPTDTTSVIVTGDPGSGKSALLGLLAALADPRHRPTVPRGGLPAEAVPGINAINVSVYAANLTTGEVLEGLAAAAGIDGVTPGGIAIRAGLAQLLSGLRPEKPLVAMIDALDEAADPAHLVAELLRPLMDLAKGRVRLLLGTRRHVCEALGRSWRDSCKIVDLDSPEYADPDALIAVIRRVLTAGDLVSGSPTATPYTSCPRPVLDAVAAAIADAAGKSFYVARIVAATQASQSMLPDPGDPAWRADLPTAAGSAMRRDLDLRLGSMANRAIDLLRPLAYAEGSGLPWEDIWALLANALAPGNDYTNEDLLWLTGYAGAYVVEDVGPGRRSVYRLYHPALAAYLLSGRDIRVDQSAITHALEQHAPRLPDSRLDLKAAHPYIQNYILSRAEGAESATPVNAVPESSRESAETEKISSCVTCPICLSEVTWADLPLYRWDSALENYVELRVPADATPQQRVRAEREAMIRCPDPGRALSTEHYLPLDYVRNGPPVVVGFIGVTGSGKTHLLAAMLGEIERGGLIHFGVTSRPVHSELHRRFTNEKVSPLLAESRVLPETMEGIVTFTDALLIGPQDGPTRPVAFFDVAGRDLASIDDSKAFLEIADGLIFVVDPDLLARGAIGDVTFSTVLNLLRASGRLPRICAAIVLSKADMLPSDEPIAQWLSADLTGVDPELASRESADVRAYLDSKGGPLWTRPYRECGKATLHVVSATGGSFDDEGRYSQEVRPQRVLGPLVALLAMTGVLQGEDAQRVGLK